MKHSPLILCAGVIAGLGFAPLPLSAVPDEGSLDVITGRCYLCHGFPTDQQPMDGTNWGGTTDGGFLTGHMQLAATGSTLDLGGELEGYVLGELKSIKASPGETINLSAEVLIGDFQYTVQLRGMERGGVVNDSANLLDWSIPPQNQWNTEYTGWIDWEFIYSTISNQTGPTTVDLEFVIGANTPPDVYVLSVSMVGRREGLLAVQQEHFYLDLRSDSATWAGYPVNEFGQANTEKAFMKWINVTHDPWVWLYSIPRWAYLPEASVEDYGCWVYLPDATGTSEFSGNPSGAVDTGDFLKWLNFDYSPWVWSYSFEHWILLDQDWITPGGAWVFWPRDQ